MPFRYYLEPVAYCLVKRLVQILPPGSCHYLESEAFANRHRFESMDAG